MRQAAEEHANEVVEPQQSSEKDSETLGDILGLPPSWITMTLSQGNEDEDHLLLQTIKGSYEQDPLTRDVLANPKNHKQYFRITNGVIWTKNFHDTEVICVP
jgi:hypothetical protein